MSTHETELSFEHVIPLQKLDSMSTKENWIFLLHRPRFHLSFHFILLSVARLFHFLIRVTFDVYLDNLAFFYLLLSILCMPSWTMQQRPNASILDKFWSDVFLTARNVVGAVLRTGKLLFLWAWDIIEIMVKSTRIDKNRAR